MFWFAYLILAHFILVYLIDLLAILVVQLGVVYPSFDKSAYPSLV